MKNNRKSIELENLKNLEKTFLSFLELTPDFIYIKDTKHRFMYTSDSFAKLTKHNSWKDLVGKTDFDIFPKEHAKVYFEKEKDVIQNGKDLINLEEPYYNEEGKLCYVISNKRAMHDKNRNVIGLFGISRDITESKELQIALKEKTNELEFSLDLYNKALSATEEGIWDWEVQSRKIYYSPTWKTMLGYEVDEIENEFSEWERLVHPDDLEKSSLEISKLANGELDNFAIEFRMLCKNGTYKWILGRAKSVEFDDNNQVKRVVGTHIDLTEKKEKEQAIFEEKEKFEAIFKHSNDGIAILDMDSNFLEFNDAYLNMLGYSAEELKQKSCISLTPQEYQEESKKALQEIKKFGFIENFEKKCMTKNNQQITVNMTANVLPDKKRIIIISKNVSLLKRIEEQERLISMGELIGNIAHQWRQPLSVISMASSNIKLNSELGILNADEIEEFVKKIDENTQYLSNTIDTFRDFIKGNKEYLEVDLKKVLQKSLSIVDSSIKNNYINLLLDIETDLNIIGNEHELEQVFINIINNAKDVLVSQENLEKYIFINAKKINDMIEITILDNGGGIDKDMVQKILNHILLQSINQKEQV